MPRPAPLAAVAATLLAVAAGLTGCMADIPTHPTTRGTASPSAATPLPASAAPTPSTATTAGTPTSSPRASATTAAATVAGVDVSRYQSRVDWPGLWASGHRFVWIKATEGSTHVSPTYAVQHAGAREVGFLVGGYHYARPGSSTGAAQARHFLAHGGGWTADGRTLPGALDLEAATTGDPCHGLTPTALVAWVRSFSDTYRASTGRVPVIYVKASMWQQCLAGERSFGPTHPLWLYDHDGPMGPLPPGWDRPTVWQRGVQDALDRNVFFGSEDDLRRWATTP